MKVSKKKEEGKKALRLDPRDAPSTASQVPPSLQAHQTSKDRCSPDQRRRLFNAKVDQRKSARAEAASERGKGREEAHDWGLGFLGAESRGVFWFRRSVQ